MISLNIEVWNGKIKSSMKIKCLRMGLGYSKIVERESGNGLFFLKRQKNG